MGITQTAARPVPGLPPFDDASAFTLAAACRVGLVPGSGGRRLDLDQLTQWATEGLRLTAVGPAYLFPTTLRDGELLTTTAWCTAWVRFVARVRPNSVRRRKGR